MNARNALLLLAVLITGSICAAGVASAQTSPQQTKPHWVTKKCKQGYPSRVSYRVTTRILKNHTSYTRAEGAVVHRYIVCVSTKKKAKAVRKHVNSLRAWRTSYGSKWKIEFNKLPASDQAWARSTSSCESGMNPSTNTGNGFLGAFQFLQSTWSAAGGTGSPTQHSWEYQAVIAVRWMHVAGAGQWPVCGH